MYHVDVAAVAAAAAQVAGLGEDVATAHLASDNRMAAAQSGWVGVSAVALSTKTADWLRTSHRLLTELGDHMLDLTNAALCVAAAENAGAERLRELDPS